LGETVKVFHSWAGQVKSENLFKGMKADINPIKSICPLKKVYLCKRLLEIGILVNGDVRFCNCIYDSSIETPTDSLFIDNIFKYNNFSELMSNNIDKINKILSGFIHGKIPALCKKCPDYHPIKGELPHILYG
jgi:hypothetical protein